MRYRDPKAGDLSRRRWLGSTSLVAALMAEASGNAAAAAAPPGQAGEPYSAIGARPFINCTATVTINGGSRLLPRVVEAVEQASHYHVNLDQLMEAAGKRIAKLLDVPWAMVSSGAAGALAHAAAACVAGTDPERMQQLPDLTGMKDEVIIPKSSRNAYDHAVRMVGLKTVEVDSVQELQARIGSRTALVMVLGNRFDRVSVSLRDIVPAAKQRQVPVLVDAAADILVSPDPYLAAGADLVAYSGGKILRGPQTAGLLLGREDLVRAAFANSAPHHAFGRPMKVSKEEIVGMTVAVDAWVNERDIEAEYREWEEWYTFITERISAVPGVSARVDGPTRGGPFPTMTIAWDPRRIGLTAGELHDVLLAGDPAIQTHAAGDGHEFRLRPVALKPGEYKLVAERLRDVFRAAPKPAEQTPKAPAADLTGRWDVKVRFLVGESQHALFLEADGNRLRGTHLGSLARGPINGIADGNVVSLSSVLPFEGSKLRYRFEGRITEGRIEGDLDLGEYPGGTWIATRHSYGGSMPTDPATSGKIAEGRREDA